MAYGDWVIGGKTPSWIISTERDPETPSGNSYSIITFHCAAFRSMIRDAPRTEVEAFNAMACQRISYDQLLNGGSKLQVVGGTTITVTEHCPTGDVNYNAALESVKVVEDNMADSLILYDLIVYFETTGKNSGNIYIPPYFAYSNCQYSCGTDGTNPFSGDEWAGNEMGIFNITEPQLVRAVQLKGSACTLPAWISVNGEKQYWSVYHDVAEDPGNQLKYGLQVLTFENFTPSKTINILTSNHVAPWYPTSSEPGTAMDRGCWPIWIRTIFE